MDPAWLDLIKTIVPLLLSVGGGTGFYLLYRKFEAERAASLREDNKTLREENKSLREERNKAEDTVDELRAKLRGEDAK